MAAKYPYSSSMMSIPNPTPVPTPTIIYGSSLTNPNYANYRGSQTYAPKSVINTSQQLQKTANTQTPLITNPGNGGGDGGVDLSNPVKKTQYANSLGFPDWPSYQEYLMQKDAAESARNAAIQAIQSKFNYVKSQAASERDRAGKTLESAKTYINDFRNRANTAATNAGQQIVDEASKQYGQGAESFADLQKNLYNMFRARNIGLSSQISNLGKARETLNKQQGQVTAEAGRNNRENELMKQERMDQASQYERDAMNNYQAAVDAATNLERMGTDQFGADQSSANAAYDTSLNNLVQRANLIAQIKSAIPSSVSGYSPNFNVTSLLSSLPNFSTSIPTSANYTGDVASTVATPTTYSELLKRRGLLA